MKVKEYIYREVTVGEVVTIVYPNNYRIVLVGSK